MTKQQLKDMKARLRKMLIELALMDNEDIQKHFPKVFPELPKDEYPAFVQGMRSRLFVHALDKCIPDAIME